MPDDGPGVGEEAIGVLDALDRIGYRLRPNVETIGQAVDLFGVEDGVGLQERDIPLDLAATAVTLGLGEAAGIDDDAAAFALADMAAKFARLLERHPHRRGEAPRDRLRP